VSAGAADTYEVVSPDGSRIGVERAGSGPALVLVHGGTADRSRWTAVREQLAQSFTLHLVDRRGRGLSTAEFDGDYSLASYEIDPARLGAQDMPVRILLGGATTDALRASTLAVHDAIEHSELITLDGHPHMAMDTASDRFVELVREFCA
jgi:pimeloyl-ACP methyl ester carboxylesterase